MLDVGLKSVRELAVKAGLSQSVVSQWLALKTVTPDTFQKIAKGLGMTSEQLSRLIETGDYRAIG